MKALYKKRTKATIIIVAFFGIIVFFTSNTSRLIIRHDISNADIIIVESWLYPEYLEEIKSIVGKANCKTVIFAGYENECSFKLSENSKLVYYPTNEYNNIIEIGVECNGEPAAGENAALAFFANGTIIDTIETQKAKNTFCFNTSINELDNIEIKFINDKVIDGEDRNLVLYSLKINNSTIPVCSNEFTLFNNIGDKEMQLAPNRSEMAAINFPRDLGAGLSIYAANAVDLKNLSRTISTAVKCGELIDSLDFSSNSSVILISSGIHTRRSLAVYRHVIPVKHMKIADVSQPSKEYSRNQIFIEWVKYLCTKVALLYM